MILRFRPKKQRRPNRWAVNFAPKQKKKREDEKIKEGAFHLY
jgi:hypothetical protein